MDDLGVDLSLVWNPYNAAWGENTIRLEIEHGYALVVCIESDRTTMVEDKAVLHPKNALKLLKWLLLHQEELYALSKDEDGNTVQYAVAADGD
jgi:hypothetical protein